MATIESEYIGDLRTRAIHVKSGNSLITDAPLDNQGKGETFSPSDLLSAALASCMLTIMGIVAKKQEWDIEGVTVETTKIMATEPRRVSKLEIEFTFPKNKEYNEKQRVMLERAALTCPVYYSLHPDMEKIVKFNW